MQENTIESFFERIEDHHDGGQSKGLFLFKACKYLLIQ